VYEKTVFNILLNMIGYMIIFIALSWDKIYYTITNQGNDCSKYFIWKMKEQCIIHKSYTCGCHLEDSKMNNENKITMEKYIFFYKYCSRLFVIVDGKVKHL